VPYDFFTLADRLKHVIATAESDLRLEQSVYGLDSRDESQLQDLLSGALASFYEVAREVHYPSSFGSKLTHRKRCDLVLTEKGRPIKLDREEAGLFDAPNLCSPGEGLWLEVKIAYQFREGGLRHGGYGNQWRDAVVEDLRKMESDPLIREAGLVLIVFNESEGIVTKDIELFESVLMQKEVLAGFRQVRMTPVLDRIGHRVCTVAVWPTIQR
jgi:hypothetical protein